MTKYSLGYNFEYPSEISFNEFNIILGRFHCIVANMRKKFNFLFPQMHNFFPFRDLFNEFLNIYFNNSLIFIFLMHETFLIFKKSFPNCLISKMLLKLKFLYYYYYFTEYFIIIIFFLLSNRFFKRVNNKLF